MITGDLDLIRAQSDPRYLEQALAFLRDGSGPSQHPAEDGAPARREIFAATAS